MPSDPSSSDHPTLTPPAYSPRLVDRPLNIVVQIVGSRGDVQPFVALGCALQAHGHRVRLATHGDFSDLVKGAGLEFFNIGGNPAELMAYMVESPSLIPTIQHIRDGIIQQKRAMYVAMLDGFWRSCIEPDQESKTPFVADAIVSNPPSYAHVHCAEALGIPVHLMFTMPWTSTEAFPHPLASLKAGSEARTNHLSYAAVELLTWQGLGDLVNRWRTTTLGLDPVPSTEGHRLLEILEVPVTYCWSPALVPKPSDWGPHIDVCGFFFREPPSYTPPPDLEDFLANGPPPVYIGFGSIVVGGIEGLMTIVLSAVRSTGVRAIISRGWSHLAGDNDDNIYFIGDCPHEWLFQQVSAVVHHGGAGTLACGLRYGRPTLVIPFFGDQPFWGSVVAKAGAGPEPIPYRALTSQRLAEGLRTCLLPETREAAHLLSLYIQEEDGVQAAVDSFHRNLPWEKMACDFHPDQVAGVATGHGAKKVKMSKPVASMLLDAGKIKKGDLRLHRPKPIVIENNRWDPITAMSASTLSTVKRMITDATFTIMNPKERATSPQTKDEEAAHLDLRRQSTMPAVAMLPLPGASTDTDVVTPNEKTSLAVSVSAYASGGLRLAGTATKGVLVDLPLAATEGLRAVPRLYGDTVEQHDPIKGFRSGVSVAGRTFVHDMRGGLTDVFVQTYEGKKAEGAAGAAKGLGTGFANFLAKTGSATLGLVSYPAQGVYKSIRSATNHVPAKIVEEKVREGDWIAGKNSRWKEDLAVIVNDFDGLSGRR
ncbi:UDP-glucose,sterol transferase [Plectosphaerella plurivora]|uniref:UDP-glucose,sterol transferase n=1 Tax=Plectosphaerella plurivora TaxID=936078 RepID=A0A9P8VLA3_9PEZI|nr:UDP-glucose,sterol transferase [Plectosphaerella plurivora]